MAKVFFLIKKKLSRTKMLLKNILVFRDQSTTLDKWKVFSFLPYEQCYYKEILIAF